MPACTWNRSPSSSTANWFREGLYVGSTFGYAKHTADEDDLDDDLADRGHGSSSSLDDDDFGWKAYVGYRWDTRLPISIEAGYVNLGEVESSISTSAPDINAFLADVADVHPFLGEGFTLRAQAHLFETERFEFGLGAGAWFWDADVDARGPSGERIEIDEDGADPVFNAFLLYDVNQIVQVRLEYERYVLDDDAADFVSLGLQILLM